MLPALTAIALASGCSKRPLVRVSEQPSNHAWWLRTVFDPQGRALYGLPAASLRPGWCAVDALTPAHFEPFERADGRDPRAAAAARYAVEGPPVEGRATRAVLVVYRECTGATGTALVLLDASMPPRRAWHALTLASPAAYAMLDAGPSGQVRVVHCQECDAIDDYRWDAVERRWVDVPPPAE